MAITARTVDAPAGLYAYELVAERGASSPADSAEALFRALLEALPPPSRVEVDLRAPELAEAELFGHFEHLPLPVDDTDPLLVARARPGPHVRRRPAPALSAVIREVVRDTGWFSLGGYGVVLDDAVLVDHMQDGLTLRVLSRRPLDLSTASAPPR